MKELLIVMGMINLVTIPNINLLLIKAKLEDMKYVNVIQER
jgi:hypothetical protein